MDQNAIEFIRENIIAVEGCRVANVQVMEAYNEYCTQNALKPIPFLFREMRHVFPCVQYGDTDYQGRSRNCFVGVNLKKHLATTP